MGNATSLYSKIGISAVNDVIQTAQSNCNMSCSQTLNGNTVIIGKNSTVGNIDFSQVCVISDSSCMINQILETNLTNMMEAISEQKTLATQPIFSLSASISSQISDIEQSINNSIKQAMQSNCTFETNQSLTDQYVYVGDGATTGNISFSQSSTISNVTCSMDLLAKAVIYNSQTAKSTQSSTIVDPVTMLVILVALVLLMGFFLVLVFILRGGGGGAAPSLPGKSGGGGAMPGKSGGAAGALQGGKGGGGESAAVTASRFTPQGRVATLAGVY